MTTEAYYKLKQLLGQGLAHPDLHTAETLQTHRTSKAARPALKCGGGGLRQDIFSLFGSFNNALFLILSMPQGIWRTAMTYVSTHNTLKASTLVQFLKMVLAISTPVLE